MLLVDDDELTTPQDLEWVETCDDCLDGIHRRCRRSRKCACSQCAWTSGSRVKTRPVYIPKVDDENEIITADGTRTRGFVPKAARCGRVSTKHDYNAVDDEVCTKAHRMLTVEMKRITSIARELNVDRGNLTRALQRRGLYAKR